MNAQAKSIPVTGDEALILLDFLQRCGGDLTKLIVDQAEQRALWNLECLLEKIQPQSIGSYETQIQAARDRLRDTTS